MCGISGIFITDHSEKVNPETLRAMNRVLAHRGPDQNGIYFREFIGLGSQRLSIIDLESGAQPLSNREQSLWIVFNGEIYNHREIRENLEKRGYCFVTESDTEVILRAYEAYGIDCLHLLNGMFAFAIWDEKQEKLFLARDRLGIKPLFYGMKSGKFVFASEIKAILAQSDHPVEVNPEAIAEYLFCGFPLVSNTLFRGIQALSPGHFLEVSRKGLKIREYWDIPFSEMGYRTSRTRNQSEDDLENLYNLLDESVHQELFSHVPLGAYLSGGLDSSLVTALALKYHPFLKTFNIGYTRNTEVFKQNPHRIVGEVRGDDTYYASLFARELKTDHHLYILPTDSLCEAIDRMIWHREKPLVTLSEYGHFQLNQEASQKVRVLLSGQGSDELFGGYYYWLQRKDRQNTTFFPWIWRTDPGKPGYPLSAVDFLEALVTDEFRWETLYWEVHQNRFEECLARAKTSDFFNKLSYLFVKLHLHEMLEIEDRHSMASSVEVRVPFLDHRLVEWVLNLPGEIKTQKSDEKHFLKQMIRKYLPDFPEAILTRKKSPMPPPFEVQELINTMLASLKQPHLAIEAYFNREKLDAFLASFQEGSSSLFTQKHYALIRLYFLERWHKVFNV
jgi:asparagine synthase (glutamine-hydrolysing)